MSLNFNTLLELAGLNPTEKKVYLLRHYDKRLPPNRLLSAWLSEREKFEAYQASQKWSKRFDKGSSLASFVVTPGGETLFVGIYDVVSHRRVSGRFVDSLLGRMPAEDRAVHMTRRSNRMQEYEGKIVIDWGVGKRTFRQVASEKNNKPVLELRRQFREELFPGYRHFSYPLRNLESIFPSWKAHLKEAKGIYILVFKDGAQYVGSATGKGGFMQRWESYLANGHGGNKVLKDRKRDARKAIVSILEVSGPDETQNDIVNREMSWQRVLGSRAKLLDPASSD